MDHGKWNIEDAYKVLKKDKVLRKVINDSGHFKLQARKNLYEALLRSIASQQLSTKAADTIYGRFLDLFPQRKPEERLVVKIDIEKMRSAGLSYAKSQYIKNIAEFSLTHGLEYRKLSKLDDEELIGYLTTIKGVGRWTAEMILMFTLNRPDVFPVDDLGIRSAVSSLYSIPCNSKKDFPRIVEVAGQWRPYRTLACRHLWKHRDSG